MFRKRLVVRGGDNLREREKDGRETEKDGRETEKNGRERERWKIER